MMRRIPADDIRRNGDLFDFAFGAVAFGATVIYLPGATYPVHVRGRGGMSVEGARALRDDLTAALAVAERPVQGPGEPDGHRIRCPGCGHTEWATLVGQPGFVAAGRTLTCPVCTTQFRVGFE